jgi:hypothetical protein
VFLVIDEDELDAKVRLNAEGEKTAVLAFK